MSCGLAFALALSAAAPEAPAAIAPIAAVSAPANLAVEPLYADIVRRAKGFAQPSISVGSLTLDLGAREATVGGKPVHLTGKEYAILELLTLRKGAVMTKEAFLNHLYNGMDEPEMKIIDVFICKLRKKLVQAGCEDLIGTVWGRGYVLRDPETGSGSASRFSVPSHGVPAVA